MLQEINRILKWAIVILLILVGITSLFYKYDNCSKCEFDLDGKNVVAGKFMEAYAEKCLISSPLEPYFENPLVKYINESEG